MNAETKDSETIQAYLFFSGDCEAAVDYYRTHLGAEVEMIMRFKESPEPPPPGSVPDNDEDKIMHGSLRIGGSRVMVSDGCSPDRPGFSGFALSLTAPDQAGAERMFAALSDGGEVQMPLGATFWSPLFGMVTDRFGIQWMLTIPAVSPSSPDAQG